MSQEKQPDMFPYVAFSVFVLFLMFLFWQGHRDGDISSSDHDTIQSIGLSCFVVVLLVPYIHQLKKKGRQLKKMKDLNPYRYTE